MVRSGPRGYRSSKGSTSGRNERRDLSIPRDIVPAKMYEKYYRVAWSGNRETEELCFVPLTQGWVHGKYWRDFF